MVRGEDDHGVVEHTAPLEGGDDLAHLRVDHRDVGVIVGALPVHLFGRRVGQMHDGVVVVRLVVLPELAERFGLRVEIVVADRLRQFFVTVSREIGLGRIVGRVRAGNADLEEEGLIALVAVEPCHGHLRHEDVGMHVLGQLPDEGAQALRGSRGARDRSRATAS